MSLSKEEVETYEYNINLTENFDSFIKEKGFKTRKSYYQSFVTYMQKSNLNAILLEIFDKNQANKSYVLDAGTMLDGTAYSSFFIAYKENGKYIDKKDVHIITKERFTLESLYNELLKHIPPQQVYEQLLLF